MIAAAISLTLVRHAAVACGTTSEYMSFNGWCIKRDMYTRTLSPARDIAAGQHNHSETCCGAAIATCALAFEFPECWDAWSGWEEVSGNNCRDALIRSRSLDVARDFACELTPAKRLNKRSLGFARDFACGFSPQHASAACRGPRCSRPQNGSTKDPSASLGISPAGSRFAHARKTAQQKIPRLRSGFRLRAPASLTPAKRLNLTKLFAYFLHKKHVFLR
jgi:hypothetical protein